jgi:flagellar hook protein FlgE
VIGALSSGTPALAVAAGGTTTYTNVELGKTSGSGTGVIATTTTNGVTATTETGTFTFVGTSGNNTQFKLNGLTLTTTAANTLTAAQVAALWANRDASVSVNVSGTGYSITGTTSANFTTAAVTNSNQVVYTAVSAGTKTNFDSDLANLTPNTGSVTVAEVNGDDSSSEQQTATFSATAGLAQRMTFNGLTLITSSENTLSAAAVAELWANHSASASVNESGIGYVLSGTTGANRTSALGDSDNEVVLSWSGFGNQPLLASTTPSMTTSGMTANGPTIEGIAPQNEVQSVTFAATAGIATSITLNGLTLTTDSTNTLNNQQVAALFAGRADGTPVDETGTGYSLSGTTGNWSTAGVTASGGVLSFTYNTTGNQELIARAAKATVVVSGGTVSSVKITDIGTGYGVGDVLTLAPTDIGGSGSDVSIAALTGSLNAGITEAAPVTFRALTAGESITIGGLTLTASGAITASAVANGFANLSNGSTGNITSNGLWSGTLSGWRTSGVSGSGVTFISAVANNNAEDIKVVTNKVGAGALGSTYNLKLTDGTNLSLKQTTTKGETAQYKVEVDRFAMFATLDGVPVGQTSTGLGTSTIRLGATTTQEQTSLGTVAFVGGKNIDSLSRDQFGRPQFNTKVTIDASGGPGSTWGKTANGGVVQFALDSTDLTGYSSAAQTYANEQDGTPTAQLSSYSFDTYGKLVAQYDNGKSVVKGQLILAAFNNFEGLIPVGGNGFHASAASGDPLIDKPNGSQMGAIRSQSVEESNVDLTQSLVKLMVLQRAYSAASQATKVQVATLVDDTLRIGQ